ncbi:MULTISPECIES: MFS transporter [Bacillus cereus group]|uniref:MFS transporter n=1 Tax=Bacillus cereus group TaxID=86661 RepID=UPI0008FE13C2|nr:MULTISPECIES: MFS transporter [Bacillus cereus group]AXO98571.1 MFS transporter [Bacillus anthracis]MDD8001810.1 MFS transporter [Bacillus cereus]OJD82995.1 macrolide transporter [Bacillus anthracis]OKA29844.1 MFS transporter [Bacillus cereus]RAS90923.1 macrolide transporter [Bacillus cereus]
MKLIQERSLTVKTTFSKEYKIFIFGLLISRIGDSLYTFALPWIAYQLTGSAVIMSSLFAINVLPIVLFGPLVGVIIDRYDRKKLLLVADITNIILVSFVPILHSLHLLEIWHLYIITFMLAVMSMLFDVTTVTVIPQIAGASLTKANSFYQMVNQLASLFGPMIAGVFISFIGGFHILWINVLSFIATLIAVMMLPSIKNNRTEDKNSFQNILIDLFAGFKWLKKDQLNIALSLQAMVGNFGASAVLGVLMYYLLSTLHLTSTQSGYNYTLIGIGGLLGSLIAVPLDNKFRRGILIPLLLLLGALGLTIALWSTYWLAPGIAFGIAMTCNIAWNTIVATVRQETVPSNMQGRVLGFSRVLTRLAMPLGALVGGIISAYNPVYVFALAAFTKLLEVFIALCSPIRKL